MKKRNECLNSQPKLEADKFEHANQSLNRKEKETDQEKGKELKQKTAPIAN